MNIPDSSAVSVELIVGCKEMLLLPCCSFELCRRLLLAGGPLIYSMLSPPTKALPVSKTIRSVRIHMLEEACNIGVIFLCTN